jgi:hypothetical protein
VLVKLVGGELSEGIRCSLSHSGLAGCEVWVQDDIIGRAIALINKDESGVISSDCWSKIFAIHHREI